MAAIKRIAVVLALLIAAQVEAAPKVDVVFVDPARYIDAKLESDVANELKVTLEELRAHLVALGAKLLDSSDKLTIEVLDLDLAGNRQLRPSSMRDVRVLSEVAVPRAHLRYRLTRDGVSHTGEERIVEIDYLQSSIRCRIAEPLCYEKQMLDKWFQRLVATDAAQPR